MDVDQIVTDFCKAWGRADLDAIMNAFAEDAVYHNIPMAPCEGKPAIEAFIKSFLSENPDGIDFEIHHQVSSGSIVFNERTDTLTMQGNKVAAPVCGVFEIGADGKITAWRDYFDMGAFQPS